MDKLITAGVTNTDELFAEVVRPGAPLVKEASAVCPEIQKCIAGLKSAPGKMYILVNALGAGEFYGANYNSDYFEEAELCPTDPEATWGYKTFLKAGVYRNHQNKNPEISYGTVICAAYNKFMHRVELVIEVDEKKCREVGHADLWARLQAGEKPSVSMGCFLDPDYPVLTSTGYRPISSVAVDDVVLTHKGNWRRVTEVHRRKYTGKVATLGVRGLPLPLVLTADHPMFAKAFGATTAGKKRGFVTDASFEAVPFDWCHAGHIERGDHLLYVPTAYAREDYAAIANVELARVMGFFLAEGSFTYNSGKPAVVQFSCHIDDDLPRVVPALLQKIFPGVTCSIKPHHSSRNVGLTVEAFSTGLACFLDKYLGHGAKSKLLPPEIFVSTQEVKLAFLGAWLSGDGFVDAKGVHWSSANLPLVLQGRDLLLSVGIPSSIYKVKHPAGSGFSTNETVEYTLNISAMDASPLQPYAERKLRGLVDILATRVRPGCSSVRSNSDGTYSYTVTSVVESHVEDVTTYNFEVEDDESYLAAGIASHNCRVAFDVCSICNHKSATKEDYCSHVKDQLGQVLPDGRKVFVRNPHPKFFDLSIVVIGADRTSYVMDKLAYARHTAQSSAALASEKGLVRSSDLVVEQLKLASLGKRAEIVKRLKATAAKVVNRMDAGEADLPDHAIEALGASGSLPGALTTSAAAGIVLKPQEFQRTVLIIIGKPDLAESYHRQGACFSPCSHVDSSVRFGDPADFMRGLLPTLLPLISERSGFGPPLVNRISITKVASRRPIQRYVKDPLLDKIAAAYNGYRVQLLEKISSVVANITERDVELSTAVRRELFDYALDDTYRVTKTAAAPVTMALLGAVPLAYFYGAHTSGSGEQDKAADTFIAKHPVLAMSVLAGLARLAMKAEESGQLEGALSKLVRH